MMMHILFLATVLLAAIAFHGWYRALTRLDNLRKANSALVHMANAVLDELGTEKYASVRIEEFQTGVLKRIGAL